MNGTARRLGPAAPLHVPVVVRERVEGVGEFLPRLRVVTVELGEQAPVVGRGDDTGQFFERGDIGGLGDRPDTGFVAEQAKDAEGVRPRS